jgi:hypothetical protein
MVAHRNPAGIVETFMTYLAAYSRPSGGETHATN